MYGHMMPGLDPLSLQYAANPNLAIQHLQTQLNMLNFQQQNMLRL